MPADSVTGPAAALVEREKQLQRLLAVYILTGLLFMLLPGTFLGVWNLISISSRRALESLSPAWLQAHGHAQIFGWIGTFILGIGFYSLSKMGNVPPFAAARGWTCFGLWSAGLALRWLSGVVAWQWRILLPLASALELAGFLIFLWTVSAHRPEAKAGRSKPQAWMWLVMASTFGCLLSLVLNATAAVRIALSGDGPALPHVLDLRLVALAAWGFLVPAIWGFNARWLPTFLGLDEPKAPLLFAALGASWASVLAGFCGLLTVSAALLPMAALAAVFGLRIFERPLRAAKTAGVHPSFPSFVRVAYVWLLIASSLSVYAALADRSGGIWGASRHALTVGFISTMVFAIGQRVLPAFCGARILYSPALMFASLFALSLGCMLRVGSEIPAYEGFSRVAWKVLPVSAVVELAAVTLFAVNLGISLVRPPAHRSRRNFGNSIEESSVLV